VLRDATLFIWRLPAEAKLRNSIRIRRKIFLRCLYEGVDSGDTMAAANIFSRKIVTWIEELRLYAKKAPGINCSTKKKAAELMANHRSTFRNLTYRAALKNFGSDPKIVTLVALRGALREPYALKYTEIVFNIDS
jgi:hypothetical protein